MQGFYLQRAEGLGLGQPLGGNQQAQQQQDSQGDFKMKANPRIIYQIMV